MPTQNKNKNKKNNNLRKSAVRKAPVAISTQINNKTPSIISNGNSVRIRHCEPIASIIGKTASFSGVARHINPGTLTWCAAFASRFETYKCHRFVLKYVTRCSTQNEGRIAIRFDSDVVDALPDDTESFMAGGLVSEASYWSNTELVVPKSAMDIYNKRYCRIGAVPISCDPKTYDIGSVSYNVLGSNGVHVGRIYVEYDFEFFTPQLQQIASGGVLTNTPYSDPALPNEYCFPPDSVHVDHGKLPATLSMPTDEEVVLGADVNKPLFRFDAPWEGVIEFLGKQAATVTGIPSYNAYNVAISNIIPTVDDGATEMAKTVAANVKIGTNPTFYQPFWTDAVNAMTAIAINFAAGRFADFKSV